MSDPNPNDVVEPQGATESTEDELGIVESADAVKPDQAEAADAAAGVPAEDTGGWDGARVAVVLGVGF
ncbi:hypothetical protein ACFRPV_39635, partial [Kitasatospora sp. NPDC056808]